MVIPATWATSLRRAFPLHPLMEFVDSERWDGARHGQSHTLVFAVQGTL
jgi:hypothetical protein